MEYVVQAFKVLKNLVYARQMRELKNWIFCCFPNPNPDTISLRDYQLAFLTPCDQAFNPPFLGGKIIELAKFCFKNKRFEPSLSFFSKQVIVSHCV